MRCSSCNTHNPADAWFCRNCNAALPRAVEAPATPSPDDDEDGFIDLLWETQVGKAMVSTSRDDIADFIADNGAENAAYFQPFLTNVAYRTPDQQGFSVGWDSLAEAERGHGEIVAELRAERRASVQWKEYHRTPPQRGASSPAPSQGLVNEFIDRGRTNPATLAANVLAFLYILTWLAGADTLRCVVSLFLVPLTCFLFVRWLRRRTTGRGIASERDSWH